MQKRNFLKQDELYIEIDRLWGVLERAQAIFAENTPRAARKAAIGSLVGAIFFISRAYGVELAEPLRELLMALDNLDDGKVDAIVQKAIVHNSPGNPSSVYIYRALVAVIMEFNVLAGMTPGKAAEMAAVTVNRSRVQGTDRISGKLVARWRSDLRQAIGNGLEGARQTEDGVQQYRNTLTAYKQLYPNDPAAAAREIAQSLKRFVPRHRIPPKPPASGE